MKVFATKAIILKAIKYGDTSLIVTAYTELFGLQTYIVKGIRQSSKKITTKANYFQPGAILNMQVFHNEQKNLQFIKEYEWDFLYQLIFSNVNKYAVAMYVVELFGKCIKQTESNAQLFYFLEEILKKIDEAETQVVINIPIYFAVLLSKYLGLQIQNNYTTTNCILDLQEGCFTSVLPNHQLYTDNNTAYLIYKINDAQKVENLNHLSFNTDNRRLILQTMHQFYALHMSSFGSIKSLAILQSVLS